MSHPDSRITHVSDTALMVAALRAVESGEPDALINDPFAARLAGERGMAIYRALPYTDLMRFGLALRIRFVDELLYEVMPTGQIATVLSVGCGLDSRPWRLDLPPELRWIEVDFPDMLDYKESLMAGETPRCRRESHRADLNDPAQRGAIYAAAKRAPALMITEGVLMYLPGPTVKALAAEAARQPSIAHWISDVTTGAFTRAINPNSVVEPYRHVQAADCLEGEQILAVFSRNGWSTAARRSYITDLAFAMPRIQRLLAGQQPAAPPPDDPSGVHRFSR